MGSGLVLQTLNDHIGDVLQNKITDMRTSQDAISKDSDGESQWDDNTPSPEPKRNRK